MQISKPLDSTLAAAPARTAAPAGRLRRRPLGTSLKLRLSLMITFLIALMMIAGGSYVVRKARQDIRAEVASTMTLTGQFLDAQLAVLRDHWQMQGYSIPLFQLSALHDVRHLDVLFYDSAGRLLDSNQGQGPAEPQAPGWFVWLVQRWSAPMADAVRPVQFNGVEVGRLVIRPDPTYEIEEIWTTSRGLLVLLLGFFVVVNAMVWWAVSRALRPVELILGALAQVGRGNLQARLPAFDLPEMSRISTGFNHMAQTLERSVAENQQLTRRLIQMQETERSNLARELHDEIGQCVAAIHADAAAIRNSGYGAVRESAEAIIDVTRRIKDIVRSMLQRLRPGALEGLGLGAALRELIANFRQRNPELSCELRLADEFAALQGEVGIAVYRVVQECLTNTSRHAAARRVEIALQRSDDGGLRLSVQDDGKGFQQETTGSGFGLLGIRERAKALGGHCSLRTSPGHGTLLAVELPARAVEAA
jgi:two-component system, NarL family, sensor histidine kinase UhpB